MVVDMDIKVDYHDSTSAAQKQNLIRKFFTVVSYQFCHLREKYSGAITLSTTLSTTLSQPFSFYAQTIYVVTSVFPWSSPLGGNRKFC